MKLIHESHGTRVYESASGFLEVRAEMQVYSFDTSAEAYEMAEVRAALEGAALQLHETRMAGRETLGDIRTEWIDVEVRWFEGMEVDGEPVPKFETFWIKRFLTEQAFWPAAPEAVA